MSGRPNSIGVLPEDTAPHRHRRGALIGSTWTQGVEQAVYSCADPGCNWTSSKVIYG